MGDRSERAVINHLIETCRDAERGFRTAAAYVRNAEVQKLFLRLAEQRQDFVNALRPHARRLGGGDAESGGSSVAGGHRTWMQLRARLASNPEQAMLAEALRGERYALTAYDDAVQDLLPPETRELVEAQDLGVFVAGRLVAAMATS